MTPRSRARNSSNRYGNTNSPVHQRGGGSAMLGGAMGSHPPTIHIVDSSVYPQQLPHNTYNENDNYYYDSPSRSYGGNNQSRYGGHSNEGRVSNASLPNSPGNTRNTKTLGAARVDATSTSTSNLPAGGGAGAFYWAAKVTKYDMRLSKGTAGIIVDIS